MTRLAGEFGVELEIHDALVACAEAIDGMGWMVENVEAHRIVASTPGENPSDIEVTLTGSGPQATVVRVAGESLETQSEELRAEMIDLRAAISDTANSAVESPSRSDVGPAPPSPRLEPSLRQHLHRATARDRGRAHVYRILALALMVMGITVIAEAVATLLWQEPLSYVYAHYRQNELDDELQGVEASYRRTALHRRRARRPPPTLGEQATRLARKTNAGEPLGRIRIPTIGLEAVIAEGTDGASLRKGPAHYSGTALPGQQGTVGIAGHRTTYQAPFRDLDDLARGDRVVLRMPYGSFRYRVEATRVVSPDDVQVLDDVDHDRLTMTACHPLYSAEERIVVFARLIDQRRRTRI